MQKLKVIKGMDKEEKYFFMLLSETLLKKTWDNHYDMKWNDLL